MNINSRITLAIRRFFKKYGKTIFIAFFIWLIVFTVNQYLKNKPKESGAVNKAYNPDKPIMGVDAGTVPNSEKETIKTTIDDFFKDCNSGDFQTAFNMLTEDSKKYLYENNVNNFKDYYSEIFTGGKTYYIQNYANIDKKYIYEFHVLDDLESTGGTNASNEFKEKLVITKIDGEYKVSNQGYLGNKVINKTAEDNNMKVTVESKDINYEKEGYNITITNKTDKDIVIANGEYDDEVELNLGDQTRKALNTQNATFVISANSTKTFTFIFTKFADDEKNPTEIRFNDVRLFDTYKTTSTSSSASKLYSFNLSLK